MSKSNVGVGVVGCGFISQNTHIPALLKCGVRLEAVCDRNGDLAKSAASKFSIKKAYTDLDEMLSKESIEVVDVCTSIDTHAPVALKALESGRHVLVEKPIAHSLDEADALVKASKSRGLKLSVIHNMLFLPPLDKIRSSVRSGAIGDVVRVEIRHSSPPRDYSAIADPQHWWHRLPGGCFGDVMPHPIYLTRAFLGQIEVVAVYTSKLGHFEHLPIDEVQILVKGEKGLGTIIISLNWPSLWHLDVYGTKDSLHGNLNNSYVVTGGGRTNMGRPFAKSVARDNVSRSLQIIGDSASTGSRMMSGAHRGHFVQIRRFIDSVQSNTEPPVTAEDAREVLRLWIDITSRMSAPAPQTLSTGS